MDFTDEEASVQKGMPIYLGIIGSRQDLSQQTIIETILTPILQELERPPDRVILPSEGTTSIFISDWAETLRIPTQIYEADWIRHNRRAKIFRDARIQSESTHFLVFLNKRSQFNATLANRLALKGYPVFTINYADCGIEYLVIKPSEPDPSSQPQPPRRAKRGSKPSTGKDSRQTTLEPLLIQKSQSHTKTFQRPLEP